jgi:hypothetical protein
MDLEIEFVTPYKTLEEKRNYSLNDLLCIIIYSLRNLANDIFSKDFEMWNLFYLEFIEELNKQKISWPKHAIFDNIIKKRFEIKLHESFIVSSNLLTFIYRILYIENQKKKIWRNNVRYYYNQK